MVFNRIKRGIRVDTPSAGLEVVAVALAIGGGAGMLELCTASVEDMEEAGGSVLVAEAPPDESTLRITVLPNS